MFNFQIFFHQIYGNDDSEAHRNLRDRFKTRFPEYYNQRVNEIISPFFLKWDDMITIVGKLKLGKSFNSFICAEHILHGSPKLIAHLHIIFNSLIQHSFVPSHFLLGTISPIVKDDRGDIHSTSNYRGVTLCGVFSHMFENALQLKFGHYLRSGDLQIGFKPKLGVGLLFFLP